MSKSDPKLMVGFTGASVKLDEDHPVGTPPPEVLLHYGDPVPDNALAGELERLESIGAFEDMRQRPRQYPPGTTVVSGGPDAPSHTLATAPEGEQVTTAGIGEAVAAAQAGGGVVAGMLTDDELAEANAGDLVAYVKDNPHELDRVVDAEWERAKPRSSVLALRPE